MQEGNMAELEKKTEVTPEKSEAAKKPKKDKVKFSERVKKFFRDYKSEVKKITWTPKNQVAKNTFVVIVVVIVAAIFIAILDLLFSSGVGLLGNL